MKLQLQFFRYLLGIIIVILDTIFKKNFKRKISELSSGKISLGLAGKNNAELFYKYLKTNSCFFVFKMVPKFDLVVCENVKLKIFFKNSSKNETKPILYCLFCLRSKLRRFDFPQLVEAEWALAFSICRTATVPSLSLRGRPLSFLCKSGIGQRRGEKANACYYRRRRKVLDTKERGEAASPGC